MPGALYHELMKQTPPPPQNSTIRPRRTDKRGWFKAVHGLDGTSSPKWGSSPGRLLVFAQGPLRNPKLGWFSSGMDGYSLRDIYFPKKETYAFRCPKRIDLSSHFGLPLWGLWGSHFSWPFSLVPLPSEMLGSGVDLLAFRFSRVGFLWCILLGC